MVLYEVSRLSGTDLGKVVTIDDQKYKLHSLSQFQGMVLLRMYRVHTGRKSGATIDYKFQPKDVVQIEGTLPSADDPEHIFDENGYDLWGYNRGGHYSKAHDRAPFQKSPYPTCEDCDSLLPCEEKDES